LVAPLAILKELPSEAKGIEGPSLSFPKPKGPLQGGGGGGGRKALVPLGMGVFYDQRVSVSLVSEKGSMRVSELREKGKSCCPILKGREKKGKERGGICLDSYSS